MAKVYSWEVSNSPKKYAYIVHPDDYNKAYVGTELKGTKLEKVKDWAATCTDTQYEAQFNKMVALCKSKGYNVEFETAIAYMDIEATCDNLRGPAGRGIDHITLKDVDEFRNVSIYEIVYDDGETDTFEIRNGKDGQNGRDGRDGAQGDAGVSSKLIMIYTSGVDSFGNTFTPARPTGGSYDFDTYEFTRPDEGIWNLNDSDLTPPIWMSSRTFSSSPASTDKEWSLPVQLTGESGKPGVDGVSTEFIYYRDKNEPNVENLDSPNEAGYVPPKETGWTASPQGVDEDNPTEWASTRKLDRATNVWGKWSKAFRWSQYGVNGQDGDGIQYIYLKNAGQIVENPTPANYKTNENYQNRDNEWVPTAGVTYTNINGVQVKYSALEERTDDLAPAGIWTDNPSDLTANFHSQWVCSRKYRKGSDGKMAWDKFSDPALWARYGQDGKNATSIRKLYALSSDTKTYPPIPEDTTATSEWGSGFPKDYEVGVNVVWAIEAEIWAHNFEFVKTYKIVSGVDEDGNVVPPADATMSNTIDVQSIPNEEVIGYDYVRLNGDYYAWSGGWGTPYIVTGVKGESGDPINYTTYVYAFGYTNYPPEAPTGTSPKYPGESTDGLGSRIKWEDFPNSKEGRIDGYIDPSNNQEMRWYQCVGYVNGRNGEVETWSDVQPCNGHDGTVGPQGNRTEVRFGVTADSIKPILVQKDETFNEIKREPELYDSKGNKMGWFATDENLPEVPPGGTMWQIWALIDGATDTVIVQDGRGWNGPVRVSGEKGEQGIQGPAGMRGVTGIPGATSIQMYCLGTYGKDEKSESYWETGGIDGGDGYFGGVNWKNKALIDDMDGWFIAKDMPYSNILKVYDLDQLNTVSRLEENNGRVVNLIETSDVNAGATGSESTFTHTTHTYYLISKDGDHLRQLTPALDPSEEFNVYVWCIQGNEIWQAGSSSKYVNITKYDNDGNVIPPEDATSDNTVLRNDVPAEEDILYKYILCNNNYYEWKEIDGDRVTHVLTGIEWGSPFKLQGTNGLRGLSGTRGQVVYPMGVYNSEEVYITNEVKAPYVYDPNDGMYYVYNNTEHPWVGKLPLDYKNIKKDDGTYKYSIDGSGADGTWIPDQDGDAPANNYANAINADESPQWVRFESFKALYTSIGIIENGLVGSAVFNNEFMFSQQGVDKNEQPTNYAVVSGRDTSYGFLSGYKYDEKGKINDKGEVLHWYYAGTDNYINEFEVNPYEKDDSGNYIHTFMPNVCINFATGQMWLSTGRIQFGKLNDRNVSTTDEMQNADDKVRSEFAVADNEIKATVATLETTIDGKLSEVRNSILTNEDVAGIVSQELIDGKVITEASITTYIEDGISNATIKGDKVNIGGNVNINDVLTVDRDKVTMGDADIENCNIENCTITDVTISGSMRSPFVLDNNDGMVDSVIHDNIVCHIVDESANVLQSAKVYPYSLQWDKTQNGRVMRIANGLWEDSTGTVEPSKGFIKLVAPEPKTITFTPSPSWGWNGTTYGSQLLPSGVTKYQGFISTRIRDNSSSVIQSWDEYKATITIPEKVKKYTFYVKKVLDIPDYEYPDINNPDINNPEIGLPEIDRPEIEDEIVTPEIMPGYDVDNFIITLPDGTTRRISDSDSWTAINVTVADQDEGATISITHKRIAQSTNMSYAHIVLPDLITTGCFYEDGIAKNAILLSREIVELTGYGTEEEFYGWVVTNRTDIMTERKYGRNLKLIAAGFLRWTGTNGSLKMSATLYSPYASYNRDGIIQDLTLTRKSEGKYLIEFKPDNSNNEKFDWKTVFNDADTYVMATGYGKIVKDQKSWGKNPCKANVLSNSYTSNPGFEVWLSDDTTTNDGGFNFMVFNTSDMFGQLVGS